MNKTIVYIAGTGRCGSTLLEMMLSQMPDVVSGGEIRYLKERGFDQNRLTGENVPFSDSPFWSKVIDHLYNGDREMAYNDTQSCPVRMRELLLPRLKGDYNNIKTRLAPYVAYYEKIFEGMFSVSKAKVIIDSSKIPSHGLAMTLMKGMTVKVIHLRRDPRAVAYSWATSKYDKGKDGMMSRKNNLSSTMEWAFINDSIAYYLNKHADVYDVNYAELTKDPYREMQNIINFIAPELKGHNPVDKTNNSYVVNKTQPTVSGNPIRFEKGKVSIREDVRWKNNMPAINRMSVNTMIKTLGLLGLDGQGEYKFV